MSRPPRSRPAARNGATSSGCAVLAPWAASFMAAPRSPARGTAYCPARIRSLDFSRRQGCSTKRQDSQAQAKVIKRAAAKVE